MSDEREQRDPLNIDATAYDWLKRGLRIGVDGEAYVPDGRGGTRRVEAGDWHDGPSPAGGAYSVAERDKHGRVVEIVEYDEHGNAIARTIAAPNERKESR